MTKKEIIREVKSVMTGMDCCTNLLIWREGRSWKTVSNYNGFDLNDYKETNGFSVHHDRNNMTLKEAEVIVNDWILDN